MTPPKGFSFPDFLNLGLAPRSPRGAMAIAPRAAMVPLFTLHDLFKLPRATTPLLTQMYLLPLGTNAQGGVYQLSQRTPLLPNPYAPQG